MNLILGLFLLVQHVSIAETITSIAKNNSNFFDRVSGNSNVKKGVYNCFQSGPRIKDYPSYDDRTLLYFQFFYDGLGITNGLNAGVGKKHNIGVSCILFTFKLPSKI